MTKTNGEINVQSRKKLVPVKNLELRKVIKSTENR